MVLQAILRRFTCWTWAPFRARLRAPGKSRIDIRSVTDRHLLLPTSFPPHPWAFLTVCLPEPNGIRRPERSQPSCFFSQLGRKGRVIFDSSVYKGFPRSTLEVHMGLGAGYVAAGQVGGLDDCEELPFVAPSDPHHLLVQVRPARLVSSLAGPRRLVRA